MVKDKILGHGSIFDVPITMESVKLAKQRYNHDLENKRNRKVAKRTKKKKFKKKYHKASRNFILKFANLRSMAYQLLNCLLQKRSTRKELQRAQSKIETGLKRRQELSEEQQVITKKIKDLEHKWTEIL